MQTTLFNFNNLGLVLVVILFSGKCCQNSFAVEYGPSLSSLTGVFVNWKGPDIWALESGRKVKLGKYPGFSTVIPLITGDSQATSDQIFQERGISTVGEFMVEAPPSYGLIAVIQELKLRKSTRDRGYNSSSCLDYIQFGELKTSGLGNVTGKICGTVHRDDTSVKPSGLIGPRTFISSGGKIRMAFNHAYVSELVDALLSGGSHRKKPILRVEVAFTAYKTNCSDEWVSMTNETAELETFEACNDYTLSLNQTCISSKLLCDDVFNCGGDGETLGSDDHQVLCPDKAARTTEKEPEEAEEPSERPNALNGLLNLGTLYTTSGSGPPFQFERKFKPYVSPAESAFQTPESTLRKPGGVSSSASGSVNTNDPESESAGHSPAGENVIRPVGVFSVSKTGSDINESPPKRMDISHEDANYGRRELADAINSVIYGVALFIVFTIFITLFVIYIGRRIQMNLSARNSRTSIAPVVSSTVTTPTIRPSTTTAVITRDNASCNSSPSRELAFSSSNTTVVLVTLPQAQSAETYDLPPAYDTLFPIPNSARS
ncbi:hypothetical protein Ocin01_00752 [Orchesella cincta]|uniref:Uncharacterized protein n=1 Tax=Orchesella cincta TaxID=48709 RepID=A0A1D2NL05_ORCCI|nr:hypothetical protein Ocin01_00752 [Orchesella cincta]